jgi:hypothetical protein
MARTYRGLKAGAIVGSGFDEALSEREHGIDFERFQMDLCVERCRGAFEHTRNHRVARHNRDRDAVPAPAAAIRSPDAPGPSR